MLILCSSIHDVDMGHETSLSSARRGLCRFFTLPRRHGRRSCKRKELMSASPSEKLTLSRLASECALSVRHFARAFRQSTAVTPQRWLLKHPVECAKALLSNRELSLPDIALFCGFADRSHLARVFRATSGVSPAAWRRVRSCLLRRGAFT
jgi:transcriptional regulator GlxA family with amidase domain